MSQKKRHKNISIQKLNEFLVRASIIVFEHHQGYFPFGTKIAMCAFFGIFQFESLTKLEKRRGKVNFTQIGF